MLCMPPMLVLQNAYLVLCMYSLYCRMHTLRCNMHHIIQVMKSAVAVRHMRLLIPDTKLVNNKVALHVMSHTHCCSSCILLTNIMRHGM